MTKPIHFLVLLLLVLSMPHVGAGLELLGLVDAKQFGSLALTVLMLGFLLLLVLMTLKTRRTQMREACLVDVGRVQLGWLRFAMLLAGVGWLAAWIAVRFREGSIVEVVALAAAGAACGLVFFVTLTARVRFLDEGIETNGQRRPWQWVRAWDWLDDRTVQLRVSYSGWPGVETIRVRVDPEACDRVEQILREKAAVAGRAGIASSLDVA